MEIKLNLARKPYLNRQSVRLWLLIACAFMVLMLGLNCSYGYQNWRQLRVLESRFQELGGQITGDQGDSTGYSPESYAALKNEITFENEIVAADQFRWTALLSRFEELLPADVSIRNIQPDYKGHSVRLACLALDVSAMTRFVDKLLLSEDLSQVFLLQHGEIDSAQKDGGPPQIGFSLLIREAF